MTDAPAPEAPAQSWEDRWAKRRRALIPVLIALTSVLGSIGAWRAAAASGRAAGTEREAYANKVAYEQARVLIEEGLSRLRFAEARRAAHRAAAESLLASAAGTSGAEAERLQAQAHAEQLLGEGLTRVLSSQMSLMLSQGMAQALAPAGDAGLDLAAVETALWAEAQGTQDLDPGPELAAATALRSKAERLVLLTAFLIAAALFLTLAETSRHRSAAVVYWYGGAAVFAVSTVLFIVVEAL